MADTELVQMNRDGVLDGAECIAGDVLSVEHAVRHMNEHIDNNAHPVGMLELAETLRERVRTAKDEAQSWSPEEDALMYALGYLEDVHHWLQEAGYR